MGVLIVYGNTHYTMLNIQRKNPNLLIRYSAYYHFCAYVLFRQLFYYFYRFYRSPHKTEFIRAKHQDLTYIMKCRNSDSPDDLNQQLHSSVRTANLETSLRLLIQGADPNYYHSVSFPK